MCLIVWMYNMDSGMLVVMRPWPKVTMATMCLIIADDFLVWIYWIYNMEKYGRLVVMRPGLTVTLWIFHRGVNSSWGTRPRCLMTHAQGKSRQFNMIIVLSHNNNHISLQFVQRCILQPIWSLRQKHFVCCNQRCGCRSFCQHISIAAIDTLFVATKVPGFRSFCQMTYFYFLASS